MRIVIVGNGVAGATCALEARKRDPEAQITMIGEETPYYFSRTALMYAWMDRMTRKDLEPYERRVWSDQNIRLVHDQVVDIDADAKTLTCEQGEVLSWDRLVLAVGASAREAPWSGVEHATDGVATMVSMQDLDNCERLTRTSNEAVVVGGGLIGIEMVECLAFHGLKTHFLVREPWYWPAALAEEEARVVSRELAEHGVVLHAGAEATEIEVDSNGRVAAVVTSDGDKIPCQFLGVAIGVVPAISRLQLFTTPPATNHGILVDEQLETSLPGVFAAGDCVEIVPEHGQPYGETIWYSAKRHGALVAANIFGDAKRYAPPVFFNSSKFFETEYTTVGDVTSVEAGTPSIYLTHPKQRISARIVHDTCRVLGFNMIGSRWDHTLLAQWIAENRSPAFVMKHLRRAQFDVEFGRARVETFDRRDLPHVPWRNRIGIGENTNA